MKAETNIMVISREAKSAERAMNCLQTLGYKASQCIMTAKEFLASMDKQSINLALICVQESMKEESIKAAEQLYFHRSIPVIFIASRFDEKFLSIAKKAGAFGYIIEPYEPYILKATIEIAIHKFEVAKLSKQSKEELIKYRSIVENADVAIFISAPQLFEYVNHAFENLVGYSVAELINKKLTIEHFITPDDQKVFQAMQALLQKSVGNTPWFELRITTCFKNIKTAELMMANLKSGQQTKIMGVIRDLTDKKQMTDIIKQSEGYYKGMFQNADDAIIVFSPENEIVMDANPKACKMYGFTKEEFEGLSLESITKDVAQGKHHIEEIMKKGVFHNFETIHYRKDKSEINLEINASVITINDKNAILSIVRDITERKKIEQQFALNLTKAGHSLDGMIRAIAIILEKRDPYTTGHHKRVSKLAFAIAKKLGLSEEQAEGIKTAAFIHDLGKLNIPPEILTKPSELNAYEFDIIKTHPRAAFDILKGIEFPWPIAKIVYQHHEKLDGSGYPLGLKGDDIMMEARRVTVANVVESMSSPRAYRPALDKQKAVEELTRNKNKFYDAAVVDACIQLLLNEDFKLD